MNQQVNSKWLVQTYRMTAFPMSLDNLDNLYKWKDIVGEEPEKRSSQPKIKATQESGEFKNGLLILKIMHNRIDCLYDSIIKPNIIPDIIPNIGLFSETLDTFKNVVNKWLESSPNLTRFAFGVHLLNPAESHEDAYLMLDHFLHSIKVEPDTSDFSYTVNRKRSSKIVQNLMVNRLCQWRAIRLNLKINELELEPKYACSLDIDINTTVEFEGELKAEELSPLFNEFTDMAIEISKSGDIS